MKQLTLLFILISSIGYTQNFKIDGLNITTKRRNNRNILY